MANTKRRTNVSLDTRLWKRAAAYGKEHGRSLSSLLEEGLKYVLDGTPAQATFPAGPLTGEQAVENAAMLAGVVDSYIASPLGRAHVERVVEELLAKRLAPVPAATPARTSTPKASSSAQATVDIPPEVVERLRRFTARQVAEASGMDRPSITRFRSGNRNRLQAATLDQLIAGLDKLESQI